MARNTNGDGFSLKDELFNAKKVSYLAGRLALADSAFDQAGFETAVMSKLASLELKERIVHIAACLEQYLAPDFDQAVAHIKAALPAPLDPTKTDDDFGDFIFAPFGTWVVRNGLSAERVEVSLGLLKEITMRFSMEDAIRAFINEHPEKTKETLAVWANDENYHVRRLVSEGPRPLLPWSTRLVHDHTWGLSFLNDLYSDSTRYVVRSVANHLNDIAKIEPDLVVRTLSRWAAEGKQEAAEFQWLQKHTLRTLVKQGHRDALQLLGYSPQPQITVSNLAVNSDKVRVGEAAEFSFEVQAEREESLMIDYVLHFMKANGTQKPKVHKLTSLTLQAGETKAFSKQHVFKANARTLQYYPGEHTVTIQINGRQFGSITFELKTA